MDILSLYVLTWNVAVQVPPSSEILEKSLGLDPSKKEDVPDIFIIGLQEVSAKPNNLAYNVIYDETWTQAYIDILRKYNFVRVNTSNVLGIYLNVFCLRKHVSHLRDMGNDYKRTGFNGFWGNKGGTGFSFQINGCSLCLINSHLAAHEEHLDLRIRDYDTIVSSLKFDKKDASCILFNDYIIWMGDLNFRFEGFEPNSRKPLDKESILKLIKAQQYDELYEYDQLKKVRETNMAFHDFSEKRIQFPPTFKFKGTCYDDKRRAAWTDRILYKVNEKNYDEVTLDMKQLTYESGQDILLSDHRPVMGKFTIKVFDNHVDRLVEFSNIEDWILGKANRVAMKIPQDWEITDADWIGIYEEGFSSLDDYVSYVYVKNAIEKSEQRSQNTKVVVKFGDTLISKPGKYQVLYIHSKSVNLITFVMKHVLGMSAPFNVVIDNEYDITDQGMLKISRLKYLTRFYMYSETVDFVVLSMQCCVCKLVCICLTDFLLYTLHSLRAD